MQAAQAALRAVRRRRRSIQWLLPMTLRHQTPLLMRTALRAQRCRQHPPSTAAAALPPRLRGALAARPVAAAAQLQLSSRMASPMRRWTLRSRCRQPQLLPLLSMRSPP
jgi:hypothetical protein